MKQASGRWYVGKHLYIVIIGFLLFYCYTLVSSGSTNVVIPLICGIRGWNESLVLVGITIAGYVGALATLLFGWVVQKKGAKFVSSICMIIAGVLLALWGVVQSMALFIVDTIVLTALAYGFQTASCPVLLGGWFPRKKGIVLGWATMGIVAVDITWSQFFPNLLGSIGILAIFLGMGAIYIIIGILIATTVHNFPEEEGRFPDNIAEDADKVREVGRQLAEYKTPYSFKKCAKTKQVWQIIFGWAMLIMVCVCFISRLVPRAMSLGYDLSFALKLLLISAICGLFGSWFFGFIDQKFGTKKASIIYGIFTIVMLILCLLMPFGKAIVWIASIGIVGGMGGIYNLLISINIQIFGRWDFVATNRFVGFIQAILVSSSFAINAIFMNTSLGYTGLYSFLIILAIVSLIIIIKTDDTMIGKKD
ncbi:MAG: MFS transporter [Lachnospiraceae bacterium]|nr:MFS transporter [Lachnospiraceae bacterium]